MKRRVHGGWCVAAAAILATAAVAWSQEPPPPDAGWSARLAALQAEHDAQADVAISIVFDDSGSMNDRDKIGMAKKAFRSWIERAPDSYRFGLVALNAGQLVQLRPNDRPQILAAVGKLRAAGDTPLADTIAQVAAEIRQRRAAGAAYERQVVVILTDGEDTSSRGIKGVQDEIRALCANRVEVIAFGYQGEGDYMRGCATHFYSPENEEDIAKGLAAIGSEIGDTSDVVLDEATSAGMRKVAAIAPPPAPDARPTAPPAAGVQEKPFSPSVATPEPAVPTAAGTKRKAHGNGHIWVWELAVAVLVVLLLRRKRG